MILFIDFETYSEVDITSRGSMRYAKSPSTKVICLGYAFDKDPVELWTSDAEFPAAIKEHVKNGGKVYAHNAIFDYRIWTYVLQRDYFDIPYMDMTNLVDTAALCQTFTLPASLAKAGAALQISLPKLEEGVRLINACCVPDKQGKQPSYHDKPLIFNELFMYCARDVEAMRELVYKLPRRELLPIEHEVWLLTAKMNETGLPIDIDAVKAIKKYITEYIKEELRKVPILTNNAVRTVNQIKLILAWCQKQGVHMDNLQAETIVEALKHPALPVDVAKMLTMRQELGRTSTAKYKKIEELLYKGVVHDNLQYHGTSTGRWAGRGMQVQNLPRVKVPDPESHIAAFINNEPNIDDPVGKGKALVRSMIKAPTNYTLIVSDYSSIENRVISWLAEDEKTLQGFRTGLDQYVDMASSLYNVPYEEVTKEQRQMGKIVILGAVYGMGEKRFGEVANSYGIVLNRTERKAIISAYREKYYLIKDLWRMLQQAAIATIKTGEKHAYKKITFGKATVNGIPWLAMQLPSKKSIYYAYPSIEKHFIPGYEDMGRVDTIMHWGVSKVWTQLKVTPGRLTENATQATAREVMAQGLLNVQKNMPEISLLATVHDEAIGTTRIDHKSDEQLERFNYNLCDIPWAKDCPIGAEGYYSQRYKK